MNLLPPAEHPVKFRDSSRHIGVTRQMLHDRTREMAVQAGRMPLQIIQSDYERARIELTGESDMDRQEAVLDAIPKAPGKVSDVAVWENEGGRTGPERSPPSWQT